MKKTTIIIIFLVAALCTSLYYSLGLRSLVVSSCPDKYPFIGEDLDCDADPYSDTLALEQKTRLLIKTLLSSKRSERISVFYRDLDNRQWFGVNENELFEPGSLLKLPLSIAYYKLAEIDPSILKLKYNYVPANSDAAVDLQYRVPEKVLEPNATYTVTEMIEHMIKYSDNTPVSILVGGIDDSFLKKVYVDLGIKMLAPGDKQQDFISTRTYGAVLRTLFNASYLDQNFSNEILQIMSQSTFKSGIVSGVPKNIKVANKFGERLIVDGVTKEMTKIELHDCGIVYEPKKPYVICIMTQGKDYSTLTDIISEISKLVYENR